MLVIFGISGCPYTQAVIRYLVIQKVSFYYNPVPLGGKKEFWSKILAGTLSKNSCVREWAQTTRTFPMCVYRTVEPGSLRCFGSQTLQEAIATGNVKRSISIKIPDIPEIKTLNEALQCCSSGQQFQFIP